VRAGGLRRAVAILIASLSVGLAADSSNADTATETAPVTELEAPDTADSGDADSAPSAEQLREQREARVQRRVEWWAHARTVLFDDIQLSAEQSRGVDEVIEEQLDQRKHSGELQAELKASQALADQKRIGALRGESRAARAKLKDPDKLIEEMRALLSTEQHPTFDMNRAHLVAEGRRNQNKRQRRKAEAGAGGKAE
jgi:hypothetical protein